MGAGDELQGSLWRGGRRKPPLQWQSQFPGEGGGLLEDDARALDFEGTCIGVAISGCDAGRCAQGALQEQLWMCEGAWLGRLRIKCGVFRLGGE